MTIRAGHFESTQRFSVTDTPDSFVVSGPPEARRSFFVSADVVVHLSRDGDATTDSGLRLAANVPLTIAMFGGETLSFCKGDGAADGSIWFTLTDC